MPPRIRLIATVAPDGESIRFEALFAAPNAGDAETCAPALLETGDGQVIALGVLCSPTPYTWRTQARVFLADHCYRDAGPHTATLRWGDVAAEAVAPAVGAPRALDGAAPSASLRSAAGPAVTLFAVNAVPDEPNRRRIKLQVAGLAAMARVRLDGGIVLKSLGRRFSWPSRCKRFRPRPSPRSRKTGSSIRKNPIRPCRSIQAMQKARN